MATHSLHNGTRTISRSAPAQENEEGKENALYYSPIEKTCLALMFSIQKLRHYLQAHSIQLVSRLDLIKYIMTKPVLSGRLGKWALLLQEFEIIYVQQKAVKGQALANFLADHPIPDDWELFDDLPNEEVMLIEISQTWKMFFDGAAQCSGAGARVVFVTLEGDVLPYAFTLTECCSNNVAEYQALILGLEMAMDAKTTRLEVFGDLKLVINQVLLHYDVRKLELIHFANTPGDFWVGLIISVLHMSQEMKISKLMPWQN